MNNQERAVMQKALEALEKARDTTHSDTLYAQFEVAITALRAALAQQEQEPVAWTLRKTLDKRETTTTGYLWFSDPQNSSWAALYTSPPCREWMSLSDEEIWKDDRIMAQNARCGLMMSNLSALARAVEAALKEKNNG